MVQAAILSTSQTPSKQEQLLQGLADSGEQVYARTVASNYGFRVSNQWMRTTNNIVEDIQSSTSKFQNCTIDNLELLVDRVVISANHHYTVYLLDQVNADQIRNTLLGLIGQNPNNLYAQTYPALVDLTSGNNMAEGHNLCKITDMGDGIACIFASIVKEPLQGHRALASTMISTQYFHTVFIPHKEDRIEVRISDSAPARIHEKHAIEINNAFIELLAQKQVYFKCKVVNFFKCINSYYTDDSSGRIAYAVLTTGQDSKDAELKNLRSKSYCARTQQVIDTENNFDYLCRAILLRKPYTGVSQSEVDISFFPHKNTWEKDLCWSVQVKKPQTSVTLNSLISDAIVRS